MSNFETITPVHGGLPGSAPGRMMASTEDSLATIMAAGYLNDLGEQGMVKANDILEVNYLDQSTFPLETGMSAIYQEFQVQYDPVLENWNMIPIGEPQSAIAALGVYSANYSNAGGSATVSITDPNINENSVVIARIKSSANAVNVRRVVPANGSLTVVFSADPGASVIEYISVLPSVALQDAGVIAAKYTNAGGSASLVIANADVAATDVVTANLVTSANAVAINKVLAGAGTITITFSADPGASVVSYLAVSPSAELTAAGLYAANAADAGGSATVVITDANINVNSVVVADWDSSANAVLIQKVTPGAGDLTILSSADAGAAVLSYTATSGEEGGQSGEFLEVANNLSDLASASAARTNLGISTFGSSLIDDADKLAALTTLGVKRGTTAAYGGGGTSNAFVATGVAATDIVVASLLNATNAVSLVEVTPTADTLTVSFSADPGAATTVSWIAIATV